MNEPNDLILKLYENSIISFEDINSYNFLSMYH